MCIQFDMYGVVSSSPVKRADGTEYVPQCMSGVLRTVCGKYQTLGVAHNTSNQDLDVLYAVAHLAMRHALCVRHAHDITFVEVGTWCGESAMVLASAGLDAIRQLIDPAQTIHFRLAVVDTFAGTLTDLNRSTNRRFGGSIEAICQSNLMQLEYQREVPNCRLTVEICRGKSVEIAQSTTHITKPPYVDFVYVDAGHTREECYADCQAWNERLLPGSWLAGHDYLETFPGVIEAADRFCQEAFHCVPLVCSNSCVWIAQKPWQ